MGDGALYKRCEITNYWGHTPGCRKDGVMADDKGPARGRDEGVKGTLKRKGRPGR